MSPSTRHHDQTRHQILIIIMVLSFMFCIAPISGGSTTKKLDQETVPEEPADAAGGIIKCGSCPCVNPCAQISSPPPPPPPPPPSLPPPPPPKTIYCTPLAPPPPRFVYVTGMPGTLYETEPNDWGFYNIGARQNVVPWLLMIILVGLGLGVQNLLR